jgi:ribonuclease P protein component
VKKYNFSKDERLSSKIDIEELFAKGKSFSEADIKTIYFFQQLDCNESSKIKVLLAVPKKKIPHAVDRNRIKRLMKEAYRLNKHIVYDNLIKQDLLHIAFVYFGQLNPAFEEIQHKIILSLQRLVKDVKKNNFVVSGDTH